MPAAAIRPGIWRSLADVNREAAWDMRRRQFSQSGCCRRRPGPAVSRASTRHNPCPMRTTHHRLRPASSRRGAAAWGFWLVRWPLVLLLIVDLLSAPLHHHHHDGGIDGAWPSASAAHETALTSHLESAQHDAPFSHSTLGVPANSAALKPALADDEAQAVFQFFTAWVMLATMVGDEGRWRPPPDWQSPFISAHRSLPPAGRAPPVHA